MNKLAKLDLGFTPMTTREEQDEYKLRGIQDGKVEELINHEKRADEMKEWNQRKMLKKKTAVRDTINQASGAKDDRKSNGDSLDRPSDKDSLMDK